MIFIFYIRVPFLTDSFPLDRPVMGMLRDHKGMIFLCDVVNDYQVHLYRYINVFANRIAVKLSILNLYGMIS